MRRFAGVSFFRAKCQNVAVSEQPMASPEGAGGPLWRKAAAFLPALLAVGVFFPTLGHDFLWDDIPLIVRNAWVHDFDSLSRLWTHDFWATQDAKNSLGGLGGRYYRPLVSTAFALQWAAADGSPLPFHAVNVLLHLGCTVGVQGFLRRRLPEGPWASAASVLGAAVFAVHPTRVESVAWVSGSCELWMTLFVLLAWHVWTSFYARAWGFLAAFALLLLGALSKETALVAPLLFLVDAWALPGPADRKKFLSALGLFFLLGLFVLGRTFFFPWGASASMDLALWDRVTASVGYLIRLLVTFSPISVQYSEILWNDAGGAEVPLWARALGAVALLSFVGVGVLSIRKEAVRPFLADAAWGVIALLPGANVVSLQMKVLVAARFWYLPLVGIVALSARLLCRGDARARVRMGVGVLGAMATLGWAWTSSLHAEKFASDETLWRYEAEAFPEHLLPAQMLQVLATQKGQVEEARRWAELTLERIWATRTVDVFRAQELFVSLDAILRAEAARGSPRVHELRNFLEEVFASKKAVLKWQGQPYSLKLSSREIRSLADQTYAPYLVLAEARLRTQDLEGALKVMDTATRRRPDVKDGWVFLARLNGLLGRWTQAQGAVQRALPLLSPSEGASLQKLFNTCARADTLGDDDRAIVQAQCQVAFDGLEWARRTLEKALEKTPRSLRLWKARMRLESRVQNLEGERAIRKRAREAMPGVSDALFDLEDDFAENP